MKLARALEALGRVTSVALDESPGKIDFLFAEDLNGEGAPADNGSSILLLRVLWCLPRVDLARSRKPMVGDGLYFVEMKDLLLHKMRRALNATPECLDVC